MDSIWYGTPSRKSLTAATMPSLAAIHIKHLWWRLIANNIARQQQEMY